MATYDLTSSIPSASSLATGDILNCPYSGTYKSITLPKGTYKLECWGAQGGEKSGTAGKGGYSYGVLTLSSSTQLYLYTGGQGLTGTTSAVGGYNGGGQVSSTSGGCAGGGGASHIATSSGLLSSLSSSISSILLVAGGGGGAAFVSNAIGGCGGGTTGGDGSCSSSNTWIGFGATQSAGGAASSYGTATAGSFGQGGAGAGYSAGGAGGGGGYYGGGGAIIAAGGGGSGYINTSKLTSASTITGDTSFASTSGGTETGHSGDGYIRITVQSIVSWAYSTVTIDAPTYNKQNTSSWTLSPENCRYFSFTPTISGDVIFYSNSSIDTVGFLTPSPASLDSNGKPTRYFTYNDNDARFYGGSASNFGIRYKVNAGTTYYIYVKPYSDNISASSVYLTYYMAHPDARIFIKTDSSTWTQVTN